MTNPDPRAEAERLILSLFDAAIEAHGAGDAEIGKTHETAARLALAALASAAPSAGVGWRFIDSAPKDRTHILAWGPLPGYVVVWWRETMIDKGGWRTPIPSLPNSLGGNIVYGLTCWQPLPAQTDPAPPSPPDRGTGTVEAAALSALLAWRRAKSSEVAHAFASSLTPEKRREFQAIEDALWDAACALAALSAAPQAEETTHG